MNISIYYWVAINKGRLGSEQGRYPVIKLSGNDSDDLTTSEIIHVPKNLPETWCFHYLYVRL